MKTVGTIRFGIQLFLRVLMGSLVSLLVDMSLMLMFNNTFGRLICQLLCFSASFSLVYFKAWQAGYSDRNMVKYGHIKEKKCKGFLSGIIAVIPFLIPSVLLVVFKFSGANPDFLNIYRFLNPAFMPFNYSILPATLTLAESGLSALIAASLTPFAFTAVSGLAYLLGYSEFYLSIALGFNKKTNQ